MTNYEWVSVLIFLPALAVWGLSLSPKLSKARIEQGKAFKFSVSKKDMLLVKVALSVFSAILLYEVYKFVFLNRFRFFTVLFLVYILYELYLTLKFQNLDRYTTFIYYPQDELYEYITPEKKHVFRTKDIEKAVIYNIAHPTGKFKIADIYLPFGKIRITNRLVNFKKIPLLELKHLEHCQAGPFFNLNSRY